MERNVFDIFDLQNDENERSFDDEEGEESDGEEFTYTFPPEEDLPSENDLDSDEEFILTELGPAVVVHSNDDLTVPSTSTDVPIEIEIEVVEPGGLKCVTKDGTNWYKTSFENQKTPTKNIFRPPKTKIPMTSSVIDAFSAFKLFITNDIVSDIVKHTNLKGEKMKKENWISTDLIEINALIGCFINLGAMNQNIFPTELIWDVKNGNPLVRSTFSRNRFLKLCNRLRFDNKETRSERRSRDAFAPLRDVWEKCMKGLKRHYVPGPFITIDEQLMPWRGRCSFLQYLPSKPDKYGLKIFWAADAETMFPLTAKPYLGKIGLSPKKNLGRNTELELCEPYFGTGRNVTCDNFFSDLELCKMLQYNRMTVVGTVRRNKQFIPEDFKDPKLTKKDQPKFAFLKNSMIVSYKSGSKKNVILISSMHNDPTLVTSSSGKLLPEIVQFYNETKGGVDCMDFMEHAMTTKRQSKRWPMIIFFNILDLASIAASVVFKIKFESHRLAQKDNRRFFRLEITKGLITEHIERRRQLKVLPKQL